MNKYSVITAIAIIVIIIPIFYGVWNIYSVEQLQLGTPNVEFSYFEMSNYEKIQVCNPAPFFVSFNGLTIATYYTQDLKGIFEIGPTTIDSNTVEVLGLDFSSEIGRAHV